MQTAELDRILEKSEININNIQTEKDLAPNENVIGLYKQDLSRQIDLPVEVFVSLSNREEAKAEVEQQTKAPEGRDSGKYMGQLEKLRSTLRKAAQQLDPDVLRAVLEDSINAAAPYRVVESLEEASNMCGVRVDEILTPQAIEMEYQIDARKVRRWATTEGPDGEVYLSPLPIRLKPSGVGRLQYLFLKNAVDNAIANPPRLGRRATYSA